MVSPQNVLIFIVFASLCRFLEAQSIDDIPDDAKQKLVDFCEKRNGGVGNALVNCFNNFPKTVQDATNECIRENLRSGAQLEDALNEVCENPRQPRMLLQMVRCLENKFRSNRKYRNVIRQNVLKLRQGNNCVMNALETFGIN
uniref:U31-Liphistoxin-Lth1a_1 n=1 Tax=Liphistius thaleban TaxID=1905330 RepID=A0A4Q8K196_9ARAC